MSTIIGALEFLFHAILIVVMIALVGGFGVLWLIGFQASEDARIKVERKKMDEQSKNEWEALLEEKRRKAQWEEDAPLREAQQREQRERAEAERRERALWRLEVAKADVAGEDVCWDCLTINPSRCSNDGACTDGCSHSCPSDD